MSTWVTSCPPTSPTAFSIPGSPTSPNTCARSTRSTPVNGSGLSPNPPTRGAEEASTGSASGASGGCQVPPDSRTVPSGPDDAASRLAARLNADFASVSTSLTRAERGAVGRWQEPGRGYEPVQRLLRSGVGDRDVREWARALDRAIDRGRLARELSTWRGIRSTEATFGLPADRLGESIGFARRFDGLTATTISPMVARREFTRPELEGGAALLRLHLPIGLPSSWLPPIGIQSMRHQMELLLPDRLKYRILGNTVEDILVVEMEVLL